MYYVINFHSYMECYFINILQLIIQSVVNWHVGCFHIGAIMYNGAMNFLDMSLGKHVYLFLLGIYRKVKLQVKIYTYAQVC